MLQACLNGGRRAEESPALPITAEALGRDAAAAVAAGAACLHIHPRGPDGEETLAPGPVAEALLAVRAAVPGVPVGVGTGAWIAPGGRARQADMSAWEVMPDYASVNLHEPDAQEVIALLTERGVGIEAGLWTLEDVPRFLAGAPDQALRVMLEMEDPDGAAAAAEADRMLAALAEASIDRPILAHGHDRCVWPMIRFAAARGLDTRIGLEDTTLMPDGTPAPSNAALVAAARGLLAGA